MISGGTWIIYVGGVYERNNNGSYVTYYNALGRRVAMRSHAGPSGLLGPVTPTAAARAN